jgi:hypothetical protein
MHIDGDVNLSHSLGIVWLDAGSNLEFGPTTMDGMTEARASLKSRQWRSIIKMEEDPEVYYFHFFHI